MGSRLRVTKLLISRNYTEYSGKSETETEKDHTTKAIIGGGRRLKDGIVVLRRVLKGGV